MSVLVGSQAELIVSFGNQQLTSPDCVCTGCNMSAEMDIVESVSPDAVCAFGTNKRLEIDLSFVAVGDGWQLGLDGDCKKISKKFVGKCTVNELLFAIREKVRRGEK